MYVVGIMSGQSLDKRRIGDPRSLPTTSSSGIHQGKPPETIEGRDSNSINSHSLELASVGGFPDGLCLITGRTLG